MKDLSQTVLYIEDDRDDQHIFVEVLKDVNPDFKCCLANDGLHAFEMLNAMDHLPSCIYVDLNMPRMNGLEFLRSVKLHPEYSKIPVFILTTSSSTNDQLTAVALGAKQYIMKPTSYSELFSILEKCCEPFRVLPTINSTRKDLF
jgi:CheY-like chemotaxis protein